MWINLYFYDVKWIHLQQKVYIPLVECHYLAFSKDFDVILHEITFSIRKVDSFDKRESSRNIGRNKNICFARYLIPILPRGFACFYCLNSLSLSQLVLFSFVLFDFVLFFCFSCASPPTMESNFCWEFTKRIPILLD